MSTLMWAWDWLPAIVILGILFVMLQLAIGLVIAHTQRLVVEAPAPVTDRIASEPAPILARSARTANVLVSR